MKIHLTKNEGPIDGYFWASPENPSFGGDYFKLGDYCYEGQVTEIYGPDFLDNIEGQSLQSFLGYLTNLMGHNASIKIGGTEPYILAKMLGERKIELADFNHIMFSKKLEGLHPLPFVKDVLMKSMIILSIDVDYNDALYTIGAKKL
jgi:hypothetical protein